MGYSPEPSPPVFVTCSCGTVFVKRPHVVTGALAPITTKPDPKGNVAVLDDGRYRLIKKGESYSGERFLNHFADCPNRSRYARSTPR